MLTQTDFDEIEKIIDEKVEERTSNLPTKEDFFNKMSEVMGELKAIREENTILSTLKTNHGDRLEKLEELHPNNSHSLAL